MLTEQLSVALAGARSMNEAEKVLVLMAEAAARAGDEAVQVADVKVYTAQVKWLRQLMKDLRLLDVEEVSDGDDDDSSTDLFSAPEGPAA